MFPSWRKYCPVDLLIPTMFTKRKNLCFFENFLCKNLYTLISIQQVAFDQLIDGPFRCVLCHFCAAPRPTSRQTMVAGVSSSLRRKWLILSSSVIKWLLRCLETPYLSVTNHCGCFPDYGLSYNCSRDNSGFSTGTSRPSVSQLHFDPVQ